MSVHGATIQAMPGDLEPLPAPVSAVAPCAGPAAVADELLGRKRAELPAVGEMGEREQVLAAAWLTGLRSARTRRAYAGDVVAWFGWLLEAPEPARVPRPRDGGSSVSRSASVAAGGLPAARRPSNRHAVGVLAACAAVCVAVIAAVMAGRDVTVWHGRPRPVTSGRGGPGRLVRRCR